MVRTISTSILLTFSLFASDSLSETESIEQLYLKLSHRPAREKKLLRQMEKKHEKAKATPIKEIKKFEPNEETEALISVFEPVGRHQEIFIEFHSESGDWSSEVEFLLKDDQVIRAGHYYGFFNGCETGAKVIDVKYYSATGELIGKKFTITDLKNRPLPKNSCKEMRKNFEEHLPNNRTQIGKRFGL